MLIIDSDRTCFFDCDDTLIMWKKIDKDLPVVNINGRDFQVHVKHKQKIIDYHTMGFKVIVWSNSGHQWALQVVQVLDIEDKVDFVMCKPHRVFDDVQNLNDTIGHGYLDL